MRTIFKNTLRAILVISVSSSVTFAQNISINETGNVPDQSAILDVQSTDKGVLIPRVDIADLNTAAPVMAPETSLLVFNTNATTGEGYFYWDGLRWVSIYDGWKTTGNIGTNANDNFVGTIDDELFAIGTENRRAVRVWPEMNNSLGTDDHGLFEIHNRLKIGDNSFDSYPSLNGSIMVGDGAPEIFNGGISLYSNMTPANHSFQGGIRMHNATTGTSTRGALISLKGPDLSIASLDDNILFENPNGSERMRIANDGRVGIGDFSLSNPLAQLHLKGAALNLYLENPGGNTYTINSTGAGDLRFFRVGSGAFPLTIRGVNNFVGINNTNPGANLHVSGQSILDGTSTINTNGGGSGLRINHGTAGESLTITHNSANWAILANVNGNLANLDQNGVWNNASDRRLKDDIENISYGLNEVLKLRPVNYIMKSSGDKQVGFIAQEIDKIIPELVCHPENNETEMLSMSYGNITAVLTKAIQEQQEIIESMEHTQEALLNKIESLEDTVAKYDQLVEEVQSLKASIELLDKSKTTSELIND